MQNFPRRSLKRCISGMNFYMIKNSSKRGVQKPAFNYPEFENWSYSNDIEKLYVKFEEEGFNPLYAPSVDRIDETNGYNFENMKLVTWGENLWRSLNDHPWLQNESGLGWFPFEDKEKLFTFHEWDKEYSKKEKPGSGEIRTISYKGKNFEFNPPLVFTHKNGGTLVKFEGEWLIEYKFIQYLEYLILRDEDPEFDYSWEEIKENPGILDLWNDPDSDNVDDDDLFES